MLDKLWLFSRPLTFSFLLLTACASNHVQYDENGFQLARQAGFESTMVKTEHFDLTAFIRLGSENAPIHLYIEGDGFAWVTKYQLSADPTPHEPIALKLAIQDMHPNVVYLARPCQYRQTDRVCDSAYWSNRRFSMEVIHSMNQAVSLLNPKSQTIDLIGYSGGAAIAVLIAAQRKDIESIRTVAGNLDHGFVNRSHRVALMLESLNAIDVAAKLEKIPQVHFVGNADQVIPAGTAERFVAKLPDKHCAQVMRVQANHQQSWDTQWRQLLQVMPRCD